MSKRTDKVKSESPEQPADIEGAQYTDWRNGLALREFRRNVNRIQGNPDGIPEGEWTL